MTYVINVFSKRNHELVKSFMVSNKELVDRFIDGAHSKHTTLEFEVEQCFISKLASA